MIQLTINEARTLAALIEKEKTTPDQYPLSLNSLTLACNQKSNRDPVMDLTQQAVVRALDGLRDKKLAWECSSAGSRVPKYRHHFSKAISIDNAEEAILTILMLRGPQTVGEIKGRCSRLYQFEELQDVQETLDKLGARDNAALVVRLPRQAGRKESRYTHLLCGEPQVSELAEKSPRPETARVTVTEENQRLAELEDTVKSLRDDLDQLVLQFTEFTKQFE